MIGPGASFGAPLAPRRLVTPSLVPRPRMSGCSLPVRPAPRPVPAYSRPALYGLLLAGPVLLAPGSLSHVRSVLPLGPPHEGWPAAAAPPHVRRGRRAAAHGRSARSPARRQRPHRPPSPAPTRRPLLRARLETGAAATSTPPLRR